MRDRQRGGGGERERERGGGKRRTNCVHVYNSEYKEQKYVYMSNELEREKAVMYSTLYMASGEKMEIVNKEKTRKNKEKQE